MILIKHTIVLVCLWVFLGCSAAMALDIVYPADKTVVVRSDFLVVKVGETPAVDALTVEINGVTSDAIDIGSPEYRAAFRDFVILQPEWDKGKNSLRVRTYSGGKTVGEATAAFVYIAGDDPAAVLPPGYRRFVMHLPEKEALCAPCHNMNPDKAQLSGATAADNPCASCHQRMLAQKYVHGPEGVFQCVDCHDGASRPARWQVTKTNLVLCGECHTDKIVEFRKNAFVHGPVGVGDCTVCHDPHASNYPGQLHAAINPLCLGCHATVRNGQHVLRGVGGAGHPLDKVKDPANPGGDLTCASCHDPHGGASQYFYQKGIASRMSLCQLCHKK